MSPRKAGEIARNSPNPIPRPKYLQLVVELGDKDALLLRAVGPRASEDQLGVEVRDEPGVFIYVGPQFRHRNEHIIALFKNPF